MILRLVASIVLLFSPLWLSAEAFKGGFINDGSISIIFFLLLIGVIWIAVIFIALLSLIVEYLAKGKVTTDVFFMKAFVGFFLYVPVAMILALVAILS